MKKISSIFLAMSVGSSVIARGPDDSLPSNHSPASSLSIDLNPKKPKTSNPFESWYTPQNILFPNGEGVFLEIANNPNTKEEYEKLRASYNAFVENMPASYRLKKVTFDEHVENYNPPPVIKNVYRIKGNPNIEPGEDGSYTFTVPVRLVSGTGQKSVEVRFFQGKDANGVRHKIVGSEYSVYFLEPNKVAEIAAESSDKFFELMTEVTDASRELNAQATVGLHLETPWWMEGLTGKYYRDNPTLSLVDLVQTTEIENNEILTVNNPQTVSELAERLQAEDLYYVVESVSFDPTDDPQIYTAHGTARLSKSIDPLLRAYFYTSQALSLMLTLQDNATIDPSRYELKQFELKTPGITHSWNLVSPINPKKITIGPPAQEPP